MKTGDFLVWYVGDWGADQVRWAIEAMGTRYQGKHGQAADVVLVNQNCPAEIIAAVEGCGYRVQRSRVVFERDVWMGRQSSTPPILSPLPPFPLQGRCSKGGERQGEQQ